MREEVVYVLRLWRDTDQEDAWRASLENIRGGTREVFASMEELGEYLATHKGQERE